MQINKHHQVFQLALKAISKRLLQFLFLIQQLIPIELVLLVLVWFLLALRRFPLALGQFLLVLGQVLQVLGQFLREFV